MAKISKEPLDFMNLPEGDPVGEGGGCCGAGGAESDLSLEPITRIPDMDMYSTNDELFIEVEMPGVKKENIELYLQKNTIKLSALKAEDLVDGRTNYVCLERVFGRLYRSIEIPFPVDTSRVKATYAGGVLTIRLPRIEDKRSTRKEVPIESR